MNTSLNVTAESLRVIADWDPGMLVWYSFHKNKSEWIGFGKVNTILL